MGVVKRKMLFVGRKDDVVHFNPNLFIVCQLLVLNGPLMPILTMRRQVGRLVIRQKIAGGATKEQEEKEGFLPINPCLWLIPIRHRNF